MVCSNRIFQQKERLKRGESLSLEKKKIVFANFYRLALRKYVKVCEERREGEIVSLEKKMSLQIFIGVPL